MLTGRRAFQGGTTADTIAAIVRDDPPDVQQLNASVPPSLASVVRRCLAKNPATRVQTADELVLALDAIPGRAHSTSPLNAPLAAMYAQALAAAGRVAESLAVADAIARNRPDDMWTWFAQAFASALRGEGGALAASTTAERKAWASADPQYCLMLAECYALTDRVDDAFEWLESLVRTSALPYPFLSSIDPFLTKLRTDPRWDPFISRMRAEWEESGIADSGH